VLDQTIARLSPIGAVLALLLVGCTQGGAEVPEPGHTVVDSILPIEEEIRRFAAPLGVLPTALEGGEADARTLVLRWVRAVERADTADLGRMHLTPAEFIALYYPESRYTSPPWRQSPRLFWFLLTSRSSQGLTRVLERHGGRPLGYVGHHCSDEPEHAGRNVVWGRCLVRHVAGTDTVTAQLFGAIIFRDGHYKFYSYASDY
jgi:hypothetical protein